MYYLLLNDAEAALKEEYDGSLFDVIVLASAADDRLVNESIYTWLLKNNITTAQNVDVLAPISKSNVPVRK